MLTRLLPRRNYIDQRTRMQQDWKFGSEFAFRAGNVLHAAHKYCLLVTTIHRCTVMCTELKHGPGDTWPEARRPSTRLCVKSLLLLPDDPLINVHSAKFSFGCRIHCIQLTSSRSRVSPVKSMIVSHTFGCTFYFARSIQTVNQTQCR